MRFAYTLSETWRSVSRPTRSAVPNAADLGRPIAGPRILSTSSMVNPSSIIACIACIIAKTPTRFPTKFGVSFP